MSKINSIEINEGGKVFNRISSPSDYWGVAYDDDLNIVAMTVFDSEIARSGAFLGGTVTDGKWNGFGWVGEYQDFLDEIENMGLIYPES